MHYPKGDKACISYGIIDKIDKFNIYHFCSTEIGSSGAPILNLMNNKIIAIHKGSSLRFNWNKGTFLSYPIKEFVDSKFKDYKNEIEIDLKIEKKDMYQNIYFLDNIDYIEYKTGIKHYHDNLKELNEFNVDLYINEVKYNYQKFFCPAEEGMYNIKLKFKENMNDCSFMFAGCTHIINLNLSSFNTEEVKNMKYMFTGCINLTNLNLTNMNTRKVENMEGMFGIFSNFPYLNSSDFKMPSGHKDFKKYYEGCSKLSKLNLLSFNTDNVINMSFMFYGCKNLVELNLSSFNTSNATEMNGMFHACESLINLDLSTFNTTKVTNMSFMFCLSKNLETLELGSFITNNVKDMSFMFVACLGIKYLFLTVFNTNKVKKMRGMFHYCLNLLYLDIFSFNNRNGDYIDIISKCDNLQYLKINNKFYEEIKNEIPPSVNIA